MGIKNVFKWRIVTNKYIYLTDETDSAPFILNKQTGERLYPTGSTSSHSSVDEGTIGDIVARITNASDYESRFNAMVALAQQDADASQLVFLSYDNYFNLDGAECVQEAITPICEGYEPVFNVSAYTIDDTEVEYSFYPERNEHDRTLRYNLNLGIPRGEKGEKGDNGVGCKGDKGEDGRDSVIDNVQAYLQFYNPDNNPGREPSVTVNTDKHSDTNTYDLTFNFSLPQGEKGNRGPQGNDGREGLNAAVTNVQAAVIETLPAGSTPVVQVQNLQVRQNPLLRRNETTFDLDFKLPRGEKGDTGVPGADATVRNVWANTTTLDPDTSASTSVTKYQVQGENSIDLEFNFGIPRGRDGKDGKDGKDGADGIYYTFQTSVVSSSTVLAPELDFDLIVDTPTAKTYEVIFTYPQNWDGDTDTWRSIKVNNNTVLGTGTDTGALNLVQGNNITLTANGGNVTIEATDTNTHREIQVSGETILDSASTTPLNFVGNGISITDDGAGTLTFSGTTQTITLNGSAVTNPSFYAPTSGGTSGQYLQSQGDGNEPQWVNLPTPQTVNDGALNIKYNDGNTDISVATFTANQSSGTTITFIGSGDTTITGDTTAHTITIESTSGTNVPKTKHELIYYDDDKQSNPYDGLFTQQLMQENGITVDNQSDFIKCTANITEPNIQDTFQQFSESPFCPEYGNGLSINATTHTAPTWNGTQGYGYGSWFTTGNTGNVIATDINSTEFNGYIYPKKLHKFDVESLIGSYQGNTTGDLEGISLVNTNHAKPRRVVTSDGRTFKRNSMYDLTGVSDYCAWVYEPGDESVVYVIYSNTETAIPNGETSDYYWKQGSYTRDTGRLDTSGTTSEDKIIKYTASTLNDMYKDSFPTIGANYDVYKVTDSSTQTTRRAGVNTHEQVTITTTHEASGYFVVFNVITENTNGIDNLYARGVDSTGTVFCYAEVLPIDGVSNSSIEATSDKTLFSFTPVGAGATSETFQPEPYDMFTFKHQPRYFVSTNKNDANVDSGTTSGGLLVKYNSSCNQNVSQNKCVAVKSRCRFENGILTVNFSKVGVTPSGDTGLTEFIAVDNFRVADASGNPTSDELDYTQAQLTIDFNNKKYSIIDYNGNSVANELDIVCYEPDNRSSIGSGNSTECTGNNKYNVKVVENGVEIEKNILDFFTEELQFMYSTTSVNYHALNCISLWLNNDNVYRADDNTVWKPNSVSRQYEQDTTTTALKEFTGSRLNYNYITEKLWYSNGSRIYELKADGGSSATGVPVGSIQMYAGSTAPSGWLICDGDDISVIPTTSTDSNGFAIYNEVEQIIQYYKSDNTSYIDLAKVIGTNFGWKRYAQISTGEHQGKYIKKVGTDYEASGEISYETNDNLFNYSFAEQELGIGQGDYEIIYASIKLPNLQQKFPLGAQSGTIGTYDSAIGNTGGETAHTLTESEMPRHNHRIAANIHNPSSNYNENQISNIGSENNALTVDIDDFGAVDSTATGYYDGIRYNNSDNNQMYTTKDGQQIPYNKDTWDYPRYIDPTGNNQPHNNIPPFLAINFIIKY